jgi:hypothetical protein
MKVLAPLPNRVANGVARAFPNSLRLIFVALVALVYSHPAAGQIFQLTGGSSSLMNAEGGSVEVHAANYTGRIDLGYLDGPSLGFYFSRPYKDSQIGAGDQQIPFLLPTDLFDRSFYFLGRGMSLTRNVDGRLFVFAGTTSDGYSAPFLNIARTDTPAGAIFYDRQLSPSIRFFSRNMFSERQTSIQAIEWAARKDIKMALSAGVGNNQPYGASSFTISKRWVSLDASYARSGDAFRRVLVSTPQLAENDRENIRLELKPFSNFRIVINRNNYLATFSPNVVQRAMVQGLGAGAGVVGFQLYSSYFQSSTQSGNSSALALGVRRSLTRHFEAGTDFLRSGYSKGVPAHSTVGTLREILNSRFSLTQTITHNSGQTNVAFGGSFLSNLVAVSVDYQTVFLPFAQSSSGQFKQVIVLGLHFQLPHGLQLNASTNVTPLGQVRYTAYASTYAYHGLGTDSPGASYSGAFFHNVVRGRVLDPQGQPIAGAALWIGEDLAVSDSDGEFLVRVKKAGEMNLKVAFDEFTAPGNYVVVQSPETVRAASEDSSQEYEIVLRRVANAPPPASPAKNSPGQPVKPDQAAN